jgi:hypothetical protein
VTNRWGQAGAAAFGPPEALVECVRLSVFVLDNVEVAVPAVAMGGSLWARRSCVPNRAWHQCPSLASIHRRNWWSWGVDMRKVPSELG